MKLKDTFIAHDTDEEQILVDTSGRFSGIVRNNQTSAFIVDCLKEDTTIDEIVNKMYEEYDSSKDVLKEAVTDVVAKLRSIGAIDE